AHAEEGRVQGARRDRSGSGAAQAQEHGRPDRHADGRAGALHGDLERGHVDAVESPRGSTMLSRRVPAAETNAWWKALAARRAAGAECFDLTESNPTRVGLAGARAEELAALSDPAGVRYEPDPRGLAVARDAVAAYYAGRGADVRPEHVVITS